MRRRGAAAVLMVAVAGCGSEPVQYPAGQRPCGEAMDALIAVSMAQVDAGGGPTDPDGAVRDALENAKDALASRAGESVYYSASTYNNAADSVIARIDPLIESYEREDPDTPYFEADDYFSRQADYTTATTNLSAECSS
ncbi:MAG: hypothetical protein ABR608_05750 [Pseudonocardiaceae bacterium]